MNFRGHFLPLILGIFCWSAVAQDLDYASQPSPWEIQQPRTFEPEPLPRQVRITASKHIQGCDSGLVKTPIGYLCKSITEKCEPPTYPEAVPGWEAYFCGRWPGRGGNGGAGGGGGGANTGCGGGCNGSVTDGQGESVSSGDGSSVSSSGDN